MAVLAGEASNRAADYYRSVNLNQNETLNVENIEKSGDGKCWVVTLGIRESDEFGLTRAVKEYKVIEVSVESGEVLSMKGKKV